MSEPLVRVVIEDAVGHLILNRPSKRNAIDWAMLQELDGAIETVAKAPEARVVMLRGEGATFSAGIDLNALGTLTETEGRPAFVALREKVATIHRIFGRLTELEKPVVAVLRGHCLGLGLELALAADFRLAADDTVLGLPEIVLGIIPDCGGSTRLSRLIGPARAKRLILTGENISAGEAERLGLLSEVAAAGALEERASALATTLARRSPLALGLAKRVIDACHGMPLERQLELESYAQSLILGAPDFGAELSRGMQELMGRTSRPKR